MKPKIFSGYTSYILYLTFLGAISPLSADEQSESQIHLSEVELQEIFNNPRRSYIYVGKEASDIAQVITEISKLDTNENSLVHGLAKHIEQGFSIGNYDAVAQALEEAEVVLHDNAKKLDSDKSLSLTRSLNIIIEQVIEEKLNLDAESLSFLKNSVDTTQQDATRCGLRLLVIKEKMDVLGKAKFFNDVVFKDDVKFEDKVKFEEDVKFKENVIIEGDLSVTDGVVIGGTLSVTNEVIGCDLTVGCNISMNDSISADVGNVIKAGDRFIHNFGGSQNTFVGKDAGNFTMTADSNTGIGSSTLFSNTTGVQNTALGTDALFSNTTGTTNVAVGFNALGSNTFGGANVAVGVNTLGLNTSGGLNTAVGHTALANNTTGSQNTATGHNALTANTIGTENVADGVNALMSNISGIRNTATGTSALPTVTTGNTNIGIGFTSGNGLTTGSGNIYINAVAGSPTESATIRIGTAQTSTFIAGIRGVTTGIADAVTVLIDSAGQLGTISSSRTVKHNIENMNDDSSKIYQLRPVSFVYNGDTTNKKQYGLIAEEVNTVFPEIVVKNQQGEPETVQYHALLIPLLNELKKLAARVVVLEERL
ncbi:MAG TPA: tail fiber domain-containing protein [Candidatus Babeliales bacterium]|nr:tail fiber domain-containing protein [Candidatus Babeliales bacterium]